MNFNKLNIDTWNRRNIYNHFITDVKCVISVTVAMDITELLKVCKNKGYRFYPVYIYIVSNVVNKHKEFRMGYDEDNNVGFFDSVSPSYIVFHKEDENFTRLVTTYTSDFKLFYKRVVNDMEKYKDKRGFEIDFSNVDTFDISCLPWSSYTSFDLHVFDSGTYLAPVITWGKYEQKENRFVMPLTLQIHHAVADGFHVSRFLKDIQSKSNQLIGYINGNK